jgi:hypothetical protein
MPRKSIDETAMTAAERQARYRAARAAGKPVIRVRRALDHRGRTRRWNDNVAGLVEGQVEYAAWLDSLPENLRDSALAEALQAICDLDLSELQAIIPPRGFGRDRPGYPLAACTGGSTGTPRAPLRQPLDGHSAARGSSLWTTGTSHHEGVKIGREMGVGIGSDLTAQTSCVSGQHQVLAGPTAILDPSGNDDQSRSAPEDLKLKSVRPLPSWLVGVVFPGVLQCFVAERRRRGSDPRWRRVMRCHSRQYRRSTANARCSLALRVPRPHGRRETFWAGTGRVRGSLDMLSPS